MLARAYLSMAEKYSVDLFRDILDATHQEPPGPTLYSTVYDLRNGLTYLYLHHDFDRVVILDVAVELAAGPHAYRLATLFPPQAEAAECAASLPLSSVPWWVGSLRPQELPRASVPQCPGGAEIARSRRRGGRRGGPRVTRAGSRLSAVARRRSRPKDPRTGRPVSVTPPPGPTAPPPRAGGRLAYLDNLKAYLIAGIIAAHAFMGYSEFGSWTYQDIQEVTLSEVTETIFVVAAVSLGALFLMGLFFLLSGLMAQDSLARRGPGRFAKERLLRLGIPFALYTLVIWPVLEWALLEPFDPRGSYWAWFTDDDPILDNGPMWFVGVLLLFSLVLAAWRHFRPPAPADDEPLQARWLVPLALVIGAVTFLVRLGLPGDSNQPLNAHVWAWPEYIALFGLGVIAARRGWLRPVPREVSRPAGITTLVGIALLAAMVLSTDPLGLEMEDWAGGFGVPAFLGAMLEGVIVVAAPVWVLSFAQRRLNGTGPIRRAMARGSYAAFMLQGPVLVGLELAFRHAPLSGDLKALFVATLGIAVSFALAYPLVTRTPLRRVL